MRYIDADALKTAILTKYRANWEIPCSSEDRLIQRVVTDLRVLIEKSITADVAPKTEVAREIFEEIEKYLLAQEVVTEQVRVKEVGEWILHDYLPRHFAELKKKYKGEQT